MTHSPALTLAPCPFCGGACAITSGHSSSELPWSDDGGAFHRVYCSGCQSRQLFHKTPEEAAEAWNRRAELAASADAGSQPEPFVVRHYAGTDRPIIKGNSFDGLEVGEDREAAEEFVAWINAKLAALSRPAPAVVSHETQSVSDNAACVSSVSHNAEPVSERAAFEAFANSVGHKPVRVKSPYVDYAATETNVAWQFWQAARAQVAQGDEVDAARYRWLRANRLGMSLASQDGPSGPQLHFFWDIWAERPNSWGPDGLDAALDAARAQQGDAQ